MKQLNQAEVEDAILDHDEALDEAMSAFLEEYSLESRVVRCERLGDTDGDAVMVRQWGAPWLMYEGEIPQQLPKRTRANVRAAGRLLATVAVEYGINRFGELPLPSGGAEACRKRDRGVSLRYCSQWMAHSDEEAWRVDFIGGRA